MHSKKTRYFKRRFIAGMLVVIMLSGTLPDDIVSFAAEIETEIEQETEPIQAVEETEVAETVEVWETEQNSDRLILEEQGTETQSTQSQPVSSSTAHETEIAETKGDVPQQETTEITTEEENKTVLDTDADAGFEYSLNEENKAVITKYLGNDVSVNIPSTLNGHTVGEISAGAFAGNKIMESVIMPDTVTSIGAYAFSGCSALADIKLSKGLETINKFAFYHCTGLTNIEIPQNLKTIECDISLDGGPFSGCDNLKTVTFQEGTTKIVSKLFRGRTSLEKIELPDTLTSIGEESFSWCTGLTEIELPDMLTNLETSAFAHCTGLTEVILPDAATSLGDYAFSGCAGLTDIKLSDGLEKIGANAFGGCTGLTSINIPKSLKYADKKLYSAYPTWRGPFSECTNLKTVTFEEGATQVADNLFLYCRSIQNVEMPDSITHIGKDAFGGCSGLTKIKLPENLESIGENAFYGCIYLQSIEIPKNLKNVQLSSDYGGPFGYCTNLKTASFEEGTTQIVDVFFKCWSLEKVVLPETVISIEYSAFSNCENLTEIELPDTVTSIGASAFRNCKGLVSIKLPKGLESIGGGAFSNCTGLTSVKICSSLKTSDAVFYGCGNLKTAEFEEGTTLVADKFFQDCTGLETVELPDTVTSIGDYAFSGCTGLSDIRLPKALESIGTDAFNGCTGLTEIEIPKNLKEVKHTGYPAYEGPFKECSNLKTVRFEEGTTQIVSNLFRGRISLENIELPDTVTSIGNYAFSGCTGLTKIVLPNSLTTIGMSAFSGCSALTDMELPYAVRTIEDSAFDGCKNITEIELPRGLTGIGRRAFANCIGLTDIEIPKSLKEVGNDGAFYGCSNLKNISFEEGTTQIVPYLFRNCTGLEQIKIPDTITEIGSYAFEYCVHLTDIELPDTMERIDWYAFRNCRSLQSITFPNKMSSKIYENQLEGCISLKEVVFSDKMTSIPSFKDFSNLERVVLPTNLESIPEYAFYNTKLTEIELPESITEIGAYAFSNTKLTQVQLPDSVKTMGERIFAGCDNLEEVKLGANITKVPAYAFDHCPLINNVMLSDSVTEIEAYAFASCPSLTSITILRGTKKIDPDAFCYSDNITIRGISGSYAETFAKENEINFEEIGIYATQIEVSPEKLSLLRGGTAALSLKVTPKDSTDKVQWITEDPDIATVSTEGIVRGISTGTTTVRVIVGNLSKDIEVTVIEPVSKIELSTYSVKLKVGSTVMLIATVHPDNATDPHILWESSDSTVAEVNVNGMVTARGKGTAAIRAKAMDGSGCSTTCTVTVGDEGESQGGALTALHLTKSSLQLGIGESYRLEPVYEPADTKDDTRVTWTSSNPYIVDVDSTGYITALAQGTSVITVASVINPMLTDTCMVTVNGNAVTVKECTITFETNGGSRVAPITCKSGNRLTNIVIEEPVKEGYIFTGWYKDLDCTMPWHMDSDTVMEDTTFYAAWMQIKTGLWATPVAAQTYTGKGINPAVEVYSGTTKLVPNRDYSLSYKNNVNVYTGGVNTKKPQIIIKGKGNYKDSKVIYFDILPKQISDTDVIFDNLYVDVNTQPKQLTPTALWNTKKLKYNKNANKSDYKVTFSSVNYNTVGTYPVTITGLGNYGGTREVSLIVSDKELLNKATVSAAKSASYNDGKPVMAENLTVKLKGKTLSKGSDYIVIYKNNTETGTATAIIRGIGSYSGEKQLKFNIVGEHLKNADITGIVNKEYTGEKITQNYAIRCGSKQLKLNEDFTLCYQNNVNVGTASMIFTGINGYSGTVKKTFKVLPFDIQTNKSGSLKIDYNDTAQYRKSGAQPKITVFLGDRALVPDIDYKVSYKNNKITSGNAQFQMKGLGNFKGSVQKSFTVINTEGSQEVVDKNKDISKAKIKVKDQIYTGEAVEIDKSDISSIMIGTNGVGSDGYEILEDTYQNNVRKGTAKVTIRGKNGYGGEKQITFKITIKSISYLE